jgi:hypothetical protein
VAGQNERSLTANAFNIVRFIGGSKVRIKEGATLSKKWYTPTIYSDPTTTLSAKYYPTIIGRQQQKQNLTTTTSLIW